MADHGSTAGALTQVSQAGVSIWLDDLSRGLLTSGDLNRLVHDQHVVGVTSNPSIFAAALAQGADYADELGHLVAEGMDAETAQWQLMISDVRAACDALADTFAGSGGVDGRVSLEVDPGLANDTDGTVAMARTLWRQVDRPNAMIKIPATQAGLPAISAALADGISVNVTLIFGIGQYRDVLHAFITGLEAAHKAGHDLARIVSVASFFVSRVDTAVDKRLAELDTPEATALLGQAGLANARRAFEVFTEHDASDRWQALKALGAQQQRPLWASTSTKNPDYPDDMYVTGLVTAGVVNTMPGSTLEAVADHGTFGGDTITTEFESARDTISALAQQGIDLEAVAGQLSDEGVAKFVAAWTDLTTTVAARHAATHSPAASVKGKPTMTDSPSNSAQPADAAGEPMGVHPGLAVVVDDNRKSRIDAAVQQLVSEKFASRLGGQDATLWGEEAESEAGKRLGWTQLPRTSLALVERIHALRDELVTEGLTRIVLCGMGGSSLAPEVIAGTHGVRLVVLDTTDPGRVNRIVHTGLERTAVVVASKSGSTVETDSQRRAFLAAFAANGIDAARRMIVVTDPGSPLDETAKQEGYRAVFHADPTVGGRYSALSAFGLVPAGLAGANIHELLVQAGSVTDVLHADEVVNPALQLGAVMGGSKDARNKLLLVPGPGCPTGFGNWVEQLVAESTGKERTGALPVVLTDGGAPELAAAHSDCTVVTVTGPDDTTATPAPHGVVVRGTLGGLMQLWETATAVSGRMYGINPFDQPDVESAKKAARALLSERPTAPEPTGEDVGVQLFAGEHLGDVDGGLDKAVAALCDTVSGTNGYLAVLAYADSEERANLAATRDALAKRVGRPVTFGWGPRFLHSTGQYHKGGPAVGAFLVITHQPALDLPVPDREFTFGQLISAQALGDVQVLEEHGRPVLRVHVTDPQAGWQTVVDALGA